MKRSTLTVVPVAIVALLAACGGSSGGAGDGVASLGSGPSTTAGDTSTATGEGALDPADAALQYAQCMREHGVDMPDPQINADGSGGGVIAVNSEGDGTGDGDVHFGTSDGAGIDVDGEVFQEAQEACQPIMDQAVGSVDVDPEREAEMREQMLEYAQCMRDHGVDFPDPTFGDNGMVTMRVGSDDGEMSDVDQQALDEANKACATEGGPIAIASAASADEGD